jgi:hypothetical protein
MKLYCGYVYFFRLYYKRIILNITPEVSCVENEVCMFKAVKDIKEFTAAETGTFEQERKG